MSKKKILGINYNNVTIEQAAKEIYELIDKGEGGYVVTPNAEIGYEYFYNKDLAEAIDNADYVLADGAGVVLASKICKDPLVARSAGFDVSKVLLKYLSKNHKKLYLLGAKPGVAEKAFENMKKDNPDLMLAGLHDGYFKEDSEVLDTLNKSGADVIFVCLGFPRQEIFMRKHRDEIKAFMMGLGGSLDGYAGTLKRAPEFYIKHNLEWLYRLKCEPQRIGRMMRLPKYVIKAVNWKISGKAKKDRLNSKEMIK